MVWTARLKAMPFLVSISKGEMPSRQPAGRPALPLMRCVVERFRRRERRAEPGVAGAG